jgi:hypothetical protein
MQNKIVGITICGGALGLLMAWPAAAAPDTTPTTLGGAYLVDADGDGLADADEREVYLTDPFAADTDGDGFADDVELLNGFSPRHGVGRRLLDLDSDGDGLSDGWELALMTKLGTADTDGDGVGDGEEMRRGTDPRTSADVHLAKRIEVSVADARLTYYFGDRPLESFLISPGKPRTPTPRGEFAIMQKLPVARYVGRGYDYPGTKWNMLFARNEHGYYIHGAYWHSNWGHGVSGGCVNVPYERMERLYEWADIGTKVIIE